MGEKKISKCNSVFTYASPGMYKAVILDKQVTENITTKLLNLDFGEGKNNTSWQKLSINTT